MIVSQCIPFVLRESITLNVLQSRIHGLDHWFRVWKNAELLNGLESGADMEVVALFALFHDSMRMNDGDDPKHGLHGYKLWERFHRMHGIVIGMSSRREELLFEACTEHNNGHTTDDPTIGVCWDADRLDIHRTGIWPDVRYMSTQVGVSLIMTRINP